VRTLGQPLVLLELLIIIATRVLSSSLDDNNAGKKIASGFNSFRASTSCKIGTVHAELDAVQKLKPRNDVRRRNKNYVKINMLIIRTVKEQHQEQEVEDSKDGDGDRQNHFCFLGMSRPCKECVKSLDKLPKQKGYVIDRVYYSNDTGGITCVKFKDLVEELSLDDE
jgi:hypothetical protein